MKDLPTSATASSPQAEGTTWKDKPYLTYYAPWTPHTLECKPEANMSTMLDKAIETNTGRGVVEFFGKASSYEDFGRHQ